MLLFRTGVGRNGAVQNRPGLNSPEKRKRRTVLSFKAIASPVQTHRAPLRDINGIQTTPHLQPDVRDELGRVTTSDCDQLGFRPIRSTMREVQIVRAWLNAEGRLEIAVNIDWPTQKRERLASGVANAIVGVLGEDALREFHALNPENPTTH
jgi:hypothetical protein